MAEENKKDVQSGAGETAKGNPLNKVFKVILGIIFLIIGIWLVWLFGKELLIVIKGCLGLFLILIGLITIAIARD